MKRRTKLVLIIKTAVVSLILGIAGIVASLIFFREGQSEIIWLVVFSLGAIFVLYWLFVIFLFGRCKLCGSFIAMKQMTIENGNYYCPICGEHMNIEIKKKPPDINTPV